MKNLKEDVNLALSPEERFVDSIKDLHESEVRCNKCSKVITTTFYPYGFNFNSCEMWYMGVCPECGDALYIKD